MIYYISNIERTGFMDFNCQVSVIVPVYNVESYLNRCIDSLISQTVDKKDMEVILVDDGSTDNSPAICDEYAEKYDYIRVFHIENNGVSNARNFGMDKAQGKYIMFLDSDDYLSGNSVKSIAKFFNKNEDRVDVVTYREKVDVRGKIKDSTHFRYHYIKKSGVYDLDTPEYMFFVQSHMNICVKNRGKDNFKFDTTMIFHEDQKFILSNLAEKGKIGFCKPAVYYYYKNMNGATSTRSHPYYIFEKTMALWESFIPDKKYVPKYVQAFFLHDFHWKLKADLLWPYHYKGEEFQKAFDRIVNLLKRIDDDVIINFPDLSYPHKAYIFELKYGNRVSLCEKDDMYTFNIDGEELLRCPNIEIFMTRFNVNHGLLTMIGVVKCIAFNFTDDIRVTAEYRLKNGSSETQELELKESSLGIFASQTKTNKFKMFIIKRPVEDLKDIVFTTTLDGKEYDVNFTFPQTCPFNKAARRKSYICENRFIKCKKDKIKFRKANIFHILAYVIRTVFLAPKIGYRNAMTKLAAPGIKKKHRIWLYCDSSKTVKDNAYYQFIHDCQKDDGIERYYIFNKESDITGWFDDSQKEKLIEYGSVKHRLYALSADKILTSFYGLQDFLCYPNGAFKYFSDLTTFELIYLQHGVLHAHLPTMYSLDRMMLDKEVVSTNFEVENLIKNYCFEDSFLIKSGMPRLSMIPKDKKPEKKILFAPSWRKFLVESDDMGSWIAKDETFVKSDFYKNTMAFLTDERLNRALKEHGYVLDFKPHPNFRVYDGLFKLNGETTRLAPKKVDEYSYSVFITDFSSFMFDFIYLKRPILYFMPDLELFEAGLNHYRKLDIPLDQGFGEFSSDPKKAVDDVIALLDNGCVPEKKYIDRMNGLFFENGNPEDLLYDALMKD